MIDKEVVVHHLILYEVSGLEHAVEVGKWLLEARVQFRVMIEPGEQYSWYFTVREVDADWLDDLMEMKLPRLCWRRVEAA